MKKMVVALIIETALFVVPAVASSGVLASTSDAQPASDYNFAPAKGYAPEGSGSLDHDGFPCEST